MDALFAHVDEADSDSQEDAEDPVGTHAGGENINHVHDSPVDESPTPIEEPGPPIHSNEIPVSRTFRFFMNVQWMLILYLALSWLYDQGPTGAGWQARAGFDRAYQLVELVPLGIEGTDLLPWRMPSSYYTYLMCAGLGCLFDTWRHYEGNILRDAPEVHHCTERLARCLGELRISNHYRASGNHHLSGHVVRKALGSLRGHDIGVELRHIPKRNLLRYGR
ncbi:hypothetical protein B0H13DRAFT_2365198 [Mycena leptocephala]|nr:hypothetical protein B0H13DRAFT_2365198 [Mycena leptocephala]